jgi:hypothetical protein
MINLTCKHCQQTLPQDQFKPYRKRSGEVAYLSACKPCFNNKHHKTPDAAAKQLARGRAYEAKNPTRKRKPLVEAVPETPKPWRHVKTVNNVEVRELFLSYQGLQHQDKLALVTARQEALDRGVKLLQFYDYEFRNKGKIVQSMIDVKAGNCKNMFYARKMEMKVVGHLEGKAFCDENHLKGGRNANWIGLIDPQDGRIKAIMGWSVKTRGRGPKANEKVCKIERFCTAIGISVVGGYSKLVKEVEKQAKLLNATIIECWTDRRYGDGSHHLKYGWRLDRWTEGFHWTDGKQLFNRLKCRANMDDRKLTQAQHAAEKGWTFIYDAGQMVWTKELSL